MKQRDIVRAYQKLNEISKIKFPATVSRKLFMLKKALQPHVEYEDEQRKTVIDEYNPVMGDDGSMNFGSPERMKEFQKEFTRRIGEIQAQDVEVDFEKPTIELSDDLQLSIEDQEALEQFVVFK